MLNSNRPAQNGTVMSIVYLIRHGATDSAGHVLTGRTPGVRLNARGMQQAEELPRRFAGIPVSAMYVSPLTRTQETAAPLAASFGLSINTVEDINEVDYGEWTGCRIRDLLQDPRWQQFNSFRSSTPIPGGESALMIQARMVAFVTSLHARHGDLRIVVISHGDPIKAVLMHYLGIPLDLFSRIEIGPASVSILRVSENDARVLALNIHDAALAMDTTSV
jgi:probable phosphomutase (TIGR03848 family)